ncbi:unnamed protein product [Zymoseptoria tritici ST99CH_1A5]|uniref:YCII-related domain-containing protein n=2 Tax=Zymoseptoria tritici TaxID=1047171 RepID=F9XEF4_ZYMTI|nr:uncharacterized protein MYCGRDRAFT_43977 [Zymoseptoria tritici IPO323]EGP86334.1 hypothetical protein MYCGRDRAFT_43977 [Zymoseptoria tritici IPO323]SMR55903.1 unnamed protein product [Zymoseptoria tritici ST99CH_3D1]SMY25093.1 unnamed protein product [Zymoseptoria tritici ST99CH_1A5]
MPVASRLLWTLPATRPRRLPATASRYAEALRRHNHEWLVILPDQEGALQRRVQHRSTHLAELSKYPSDFILVGGPYLGGPVQDDAPMDMLGSVILVRASTREEALGELRKDIFARKAVWDFDQALVLPFKSTIRKGM